MCELASIMGTSPNRCNLLFGLLEYRALLQSLGYSFGLQFIDGSFVENVELREGRDPGDIDVFSFLVRPAHYRNDPALWASTGFPEWSSEVADRTKNKQRFLIDTYAIAIDQGGPLGVITETIYWYSLFSHKKITHDWKGFVQVSVSATDDAAARTALLTGP
jgi:hypothetical protein